MQHKSHSKCRLSIEKLLKIECNRSKSCVCSVSVLRLIIGVQIASTATTKLHFKLFQSSTSGLMMEFASAGSSHVSLFLPLPFFPSPLPSPLTPFTFCCRCETGGPVAVSWLLNVYLFWSAGQKGVACDPEEPRPRASSLWRAGKVALGRRPRALTRAHPRALSFMCAPLHVARSFHCFSGNNSFAPLSQGKEPLSNFPLYVALCKPSPLFFKHVEFALSSETIASFELKMNY